jgi:hypothetical protein
MSVPLIHFVNVTITLAGAQPDVFGFGSALGAFAHTITVGSDRVEGPFVTRDEITAAGFTSVATPEISAWADAVFAQSPHVESVKIGRKDAGDASWTATLDAILASDDDWYFLNTENRDEADILLCAAWTETNGGGESPKLFITQSQDAALLAGTAGNVGLDLEAAAYTRTGLIYHRFSDANDGLVPGDGYLDGAWTGRCGGFNLDAPNGRGTWSLKPLLLVTFDPLTSAQATAIWDASANVYGRTKGLSFTSKGTVAQGRKIYVTSSIDWGKVRLGEAILAELVGDPLEVPYTNAGIQRVRNTAQGVLERGVTFGHFSPDFPREIIAPKVTEVSSADRAAGVLTMTGNAVLRSTIEKVVFNLTVQL